jgi:glycosyltransferase involved in cell wall biosynthesis
MGQEVLDTAVGGISIVVPAFDEADNVVSAIEDISRVAGTLGTDYEIILVNDGSRDATGDIARAELLGRVRNLTLVEHFPNRGYGGALKAGFAAATMETIVFVAADRQFDFSEVTLLLAELEPGVVLVSGRRVERRDPAIRRLNAAGWNTAVTLLFGLSVHDIDCGFKVFRREALDHVAIESDGAMIDTELLAGLRARGYRLAEVPVTHLPRIEGRPTGASPRVIARAFRDLFAFRVRLSRELREERSAARV